MSKKAFVAWTMTIVVGACATGHDEATCLAFRPIRPTLFDTDRMSDDLAGQILVHDETGRRLCGWRP